MLTQQAPKKETKASLDPGCQGIERGGLAKGLATTRLVSCDYHSHIPSFTNCHRQIRRGLAAGIGRFPHFPWMD
jgi:hypothetical protein